MLSIFHKMLWILVIYLCIAPTMQEPICRPVLSDGKVGKPDIGGFISFECDISTCMNIKKVVFEKIDPNGSWVPVYERVNATYNRALATAKGYTLDNRDEYYGFRTQHTLHIMPLILQDHGKWRCVVYEDKHEEHKSGPLNFNIYVPPAEENFFIRPNNSHLVVNQPQTFTCLASGVHPEPIVLWEVNGVEYVGNTTSQKREDQLWIVISALQIKFDAAGVNQLNCVMMTKAKDPWLVDHINITVQEQATVHYPLHELTTTVNVDSSFSLKCTASGYFPHITWQRNGEHILGNDTRYMVHEDCDNSQCEGSITSPSLAPALACIENEPYSGVYMCVITLESPYQSSATSPYMNVTISKIQCKEENIGRKAGLSMLLVAGVVLVAFLIGFLGYRKRHKTDIAFYNSMTLDQTFKHECITEARLNRCAQRRVDDQLVLFEYGTQRVFKHNIDDLTQQKEYTCDVNIHDMIRTSSKSHDRFIVTAKTTNFIHLLGLQRQALRRLDTLPRETDIKNTLICPEADTSFIKCDVSHYIPNDNNDEDGINEDDDLESGRGQYKISMWRVSITLDKLKKHHIRDVTLKKEPLFISLTPDNKRIVMVPVNGDIYLVKLQKSSSDHTKLNFRDDINTSVRSLFINNHDVILGDFDGKIVVSDRDLRHTAIQNAETPVNGITVRGKKMIACCGHEGQEQYIKVFVSKQRCFNI